MLSTFIDLTRFREKLKLIANSGWLFLFEFFEQTYKKNLSRIYMIVHKYHDKNLVKSQTKRTNDT